jgi:hypothetical protein
MTAGSHLDDQKPGTKGPPALTAEVEVLLDFGVTDFFGALMRSNWKEVLKIQNVKAFFRVQALFLRRIVTVQNKRIPSIVVTVVRVGRIAYS